MFRAGPEVDFVDVVDDPLEVGDQDPLALALAVAHVVDGVDGGTVGHQGRGHVFVPARVLPVPVGQQDHVGGVLPR
jgi:hypothetical protein